MPHLLISPENWPRPSGYAHAVLANGDYLFVSGQVGWDVHHNFAQDLVGQVKQALRNIIAILDEASGRAEHIVRQVWYVVDCDEYHARQREIGVVYRQVIGRHFPAITVVEVRRLLEPAALVEIEVTAVLAG